MWKLFIQVVHMMYKITILKLLSPLLMRSCHYHSNNNMEFDYANLTQVCSYGYTSLQPQKQ